MEAEERPKKLQKLDKHETESSVEQADTPLLSDVNANTSGPATENSKPQETAANIANDPEEDDAASDSDVASSRKRIRHKDPDPAEHERQLLQQAQNGTSTASLSKNQLKKLRRREEWEANRPHRKEKRKQKTQEKKARKRAAREEEHNQLQQSQQVADAAGAQDGDASRNALAKPPRQPQPPSAPKPNFRRPIQLPITIIIDCGFDSLMMEKERISLGSQLTRSYSDNNRALYRAHLVISSFNGLLKERFDTVLHKHYLNWKSVRFEERDFVDVAQEMEEVMRHPKHGGHLVGSFQKFASPNTNGESRSKLSKAPGESTDTLLRTGSASVEAITESDPSSRTDSGMQGESAREEPISAQKDHEPLPATSSPSPPMPTPSIPQGEVIYLTSDSPHTLSTLSPYSTYVIGGLVDKNRHKGICYKLAREKGIKTAKLPIGEFLQMSSRKVLATNHVVEILLAWLEEAAARIDGEGGDEAERGAWERAFLKVIPKRKGGVLKGQQQQEGDGKVNEDDVGGSDEDIEDEDEIEREHGVEEDADDDGLVSRGDMAA